jgi:DNA-binding NarL/FixJ family response regulator
MEPTRVLLADDHPVFLGGMHALLDSSPGVEVVGEAATGDQAVTAATQRQPDVVVMDIQMPGLNGIDATREIVARSPHIGVLILTMFEVGFQGVRSIPSSPRSAGGGVSGRGR